MNARFISLLVLVGCSCGDRKIDDDDMGRAPPPDAGPADLGEGDGEVVCREGLVACDGACLDLSSNDEHCGVCGHACKSPTVFGHCKAGGCPWAKFCGSVEMGFTTCEDVCASYGQRCDDEPSAPGTNGCGGNAGQILYFPELGKSAFELCETRLGSSFLVGGKCSDPIDWSIVYGWDEQPAGAVECCCTQEAP